MSDRSVAYLKDRRTGQLVEAILIDGVSREEVERAESAWQPFLAQALEDRRRLADPPKPAPEHSHWDWRKKHKAVAGLIAYRMFGIECENDIQGLMLVSTTGHACRLKDQKSKDQVYVDFVATAPWNSPSLVEKPR